MKIIATLLSAMALAGLAFAVVIHYKHKREDAVAAYVLHNIDVRHDACVKAAADANPAGFDECKKDNRFDDDTCRAMAAGSGYTACNNDAETAVQEWQRLYPRQALEEQQRQDDRQRQRDEKQMLK
jgi:hypothetical protein